MQRRIKMQRRELRRLNKKMGEYKNERYSISRLKRFAKTAPIHVNKGRTVATVAKMLVDQGEEQVAGVLVQMFGSGEPYEVCDE